MNRGKTVKNQPNEKYSTKVYERILEDEQEHFKQPTDNQIDEQQLQQQGQDQIEMVINFGEDNCSSLLVRSFDDPLSLAKNFCSKHNIDPVIIETLAENIRSVQASSFRQERETSFKIQRNQSYFDDKQNSNRANTYHNRQSTSKNSQSKNISMNRNKAEESFVNDRLPSYTSNSKRGNSGNNTMRYNVFQRLYQDSRKKKLQKLEDVNSLCVSKREGSQMSENMVNNNRFLNESMTNSCLQIYDKNTKLQEASRKHNQYLLQLKKQKEINECKFKPQINHLSNLIASKLRELDESSIINRSGNDRQASKIKQYLFKREEQQLKECTFQPKIINKLSDQSIISSKRYLQLHEDHLLREARKKMMTKQTLKKEEEFHNPVINDISKIIVCKNFEQRLEEDTQKRLTKKESERKSKQVKNSLQKRPSTGRPPVNRDLGDKTIGEYLYEKSKASRTLTVKEQPKMLLDPKSSQIHAESKRFAFQHLFQLLDSDGDGLISNLKINIGGLSSNILRLLAPLLSQMEEVEVQLNEEEFSLAFERLFATLSVAEKNQILKANKGRGSNSRVSEQPSFKPALNERSLSMARELCEEDGDIYEQSCQRLRERDNKLARMRAERILQEYSQCSFHPKLYN